MNPIEGRERGSSEYVEIHRSSVEAVDSVLARLHGEGIEAIALDAPGFVPAAGSMAADLGGPVHEGAFFDASATYVGAFEPGGTDWTAGWTAYPPLPE